jgi:hypothetical protein
VCVRKGDFAILRVLTNAFTNNRCRLLESITALAPMASMDHIANFPSSAPAPESYKTCNLQCQNEGVCAEGNKDHGILNGLDDIEHLVNTSDVTRWNIAFALLVCGAAL